MKLLLDTHAFIWWDSDPAKLSPAAHSACVSAANSLVLSAASIWEMAIKQHLGKLKLRLPLSELVDAQSTGNGLEILPVAAAHVYALERLPGHHKDPFDRLLIAQAVQERAVIVSADAAFAQYPVELCW